MNDIVESPLNELSPDKSNPRKPDEARFALLTLSLQKLGFLLPVHANAQGLILSGHQRHAIASALGYETAPAVFHELTAKKQKGINILFNRTTNDFNAFDTGSKAKEHLSLSDVVDAAEEFPDYVDEYGEDWFAYAAEEENIVSLGKGIANRYDKKPVVVATQLQKLGIRIPIVLAEDGRVVNGVYRLFAARESGIKRWPTITIWNEWADLALNFLNYLSMDYEVNEEFADLLRYSAYRRPQNQRGAIPKGMRFWANGNRTIIDRKSYTKDYWSAFRDIHGGSILDFGSGLSKAKAFLEKKGFKVVDFEPYRIEPDSGTASPSPRYSKQMAKQFLQEVADGRPFDSIFMASVLNSIPFPEDRMAVLAIVHSLCGFSSGVYGTCRDISDFDYQYSGLRNPSHFVFDSEPGVRLADSLARPKIQKFHERGEIYDILRMFWNRVETWPGGNIFYWSAKAPKRTNPNVLSKALEIEFNLPYADGSRMGLVKEAKEAFSQRLGISL